MSSDWTETQLGSVASLCLGKMLDKAKNKGTLKPYLRNANVRWGDFDLSDVQQMAFEDHEEDRYTLARGDIVMCEGGEPGRCAVWSRTDRFYIQKALHRIRCAPGLDPKFLSYQFRLLAADGTLSKSLTGSTIKHLPGEKLAEVRVRFPSLPEQHRIVAEIEKHFTRLDDAVATLKRVQASLKQARASVLKAAVEGRLVPTEAELARAEGRTYEPASVLLERILSERKRRHEETNGKKKYKPPVEPETRGLPPLPEGWGWVTVDQLIREKLRNGKSARATEGQGGIRTLSLSAVTERSFTDANTKLTVATSEQVDGLWLEPGDILVQRSNTPELVGTAALFSGPRDWAVFPDLLIRVRLCSDAVPSWVECVLRAPRIREFFKQRAQGIAGSMPKIDQETVARAVIPLPPKQEQSRIVAEVSRRLSVLDALDQTIRLNLSRCAHLRQSILKRAFSGKLVPQDAADEPASALLERIRATAVP